ncbi:hypothetical protein L7F22_025250, partial [Adiantum nelumboides]|nr:hypothetical protein [Adiantum nelumboides]
EPHGNYGMEVTKAFSRGFLYKHLRGTINWAAFTESIVANMESSKLQQLNKKRWATFHFASAPRSSQRMIVVTNVNDGDANRGSGLHIAAKFLRLGNLSLCELNDVGMAVALSQAKALM